MGEKVIFPKRPGIVEELIEELKRQLSLQYDFMPYYGMKSSCLTYYPDFNNAFCNLTDITELPDRATQKIVSLESVCLTLCSTSALSSTSMLSTASSSDTEILPRTEETLHGPWHLRYHISQSILHTD